MAFYQNEVLTIGMALKLVTGSASKRYGIEHSGIVWFLKHLIFKVLKTTSLKDKWNFAFNIKIKKTFETKTVMR